MINTLAFRLLVLALGASLITTAAIGWIWHDQIVEVERHATAQTQSNRIHEMLDLLNEMKVSERQIVLRRLKKENLYFISGLTYYFFPPILPMPSDHPSAPVFSAILNQMAPFRVVAAGMSTNNGFDDDIAKPLQPLFLDSRLASMVVQLTDGTFVWVGMDAAFFRQRLLIPLLVPVLSVLLPLLIVIALTFYWVLLPLRTLTRAAESIGESLHQQLKLPKSELREIKVASETMAWMHGRLKQQFNRLMIALGALSHDLRTPLQRLRFRVELIEDETLRAQMDHDIEELHQRVEDGLFYLRSSSEKPPTTPTPLAKRLEEWMSHYLDAGKNVRFIRQPDWPADDPRWMINVHWVSLARALGNVVDNALVYGHAAELTLQAQTTPTKGMRLTVIDQGAGIPESEWEQAFEPFVRLDPSRAHIDPINEDAPINPKTPAKPVGGSGLGLAIAKGVVEQHGGTIHLANRAADQGGGLVVSIFLPCVNPASKGAV